MAIDRVRTPNLPSTPCYSEVPLHEDRKKAWSTFSRVAVVAVILFLMVATLKAIPAHAQAAPGPVPSPRADCTTTRTTITKQESVEHPDGDSEASQEQSSVVRVYCLGTRA